MSARGALCLAAVAMLGLAAAPGLRADAADGTAHVLVRFRGGMGLAERGALERHEGLMRRQLELGRDSVAAIELPAREIDALRREPGVALVEEDAWRYPAALANTELTPAMDNGLYGLVLTRAIRAQSRKVIGAGVAVCVVDTGVDMHHPDLVGAVMGGVDTVDGDDNPDVGADAGLGGHGTMVDGVIAAALNRKGVRGVAYGATIWHGRALGVDGGRVSDIMGAAQELVEQHGCHVLNLSLGGEAFSQVEQDFYRNLAANGDVLILAAAGNGGGTGTVMYPAAYPDVVAVGAIDRTAAHAEFSDSGPQLALSAPGVSILSSVPRGSGSETSLVAGTRSIPANPLDFSGHTTRTGLVRRRVVDCGTGNTPDEFPKSVEGAIAVMRRGDAFFWQKVVNAMDAGAVGAVIYNNVAGEYRGTLLTAAAPDGRKWLPVLSVTTANGNALRKKRTIATMVNAPSDWGTADGTSFASPHVAGAAALIWSVAPQLHRGDVLQLLERTAIDLGPPGRDPIFGFGMIDVDAATRAAAGN